MTDMEPTFQGEVMLLSWSETHSGGAKIVLQLADPADLEPFKTMTVKHGKIAGQRLMCVLVEIGDDERPVERDLQWTPEERERLAASDASPLRLNTIPKGGPLAKLAGRWCEDENFQRWIGVAFPGREDAPKLASNLLRGICGIESRAQLDHDDNARTLFDYHIRHPYSAYLASKP